MMRDFIERLKNKEDLTQEQISKVVGDIVSGEALDEDVKDFLSAMNGKGATVAEITAAARVLRERSIKVATNRPVVLDTCGTGGDQKHTFNISTLVALVAAGAGVTVAKHGNRSVSSKCGSADILEGLGVALDMDAGQLSSCLDEVGIAFLFAQNLHPAMKHVARARKELGVKTIFNVLGPLTNPAAATHQMTGVYSRDLVAPVAEALKNLGLKRVLVVHGRDGLDEITTTDTTWAREYDGRALRTYEIDPRDFGIPRASEEDLKGGDLAANIGITQAILDGGKGPKRDIVLINAAYALLVAERVKDVAQGLALATEILDSGKAKEKLSALQKFSRR